MAVPGFDRLDETLAALSDAEWEAHVDELEALWEAENSERLAGGQDALSYVEFGLAFASGGSRRTRAQAAAAAAAAAAPATPKVHVRDDEVDPDRTCRGGVGLGKDEGVPVPIHDNNNNRNASGTISPNPSNKVAPRDIRTWLTGCAALMLVSGWGWLVLSERDGARRKQDVWELGMTMLLVCGAAVLLRLARPH